MAQKTFETVMSDMLSYVKDKYPEIDTREGSIIYTALAPAAAELVTAYFEMDMINEQTFLSTASKEYLVKHGEQLGVPLEEATFAQFKGEFNIDVAIGTRFNLDEFNYSVIEKLSDPTDENEYYTFLLVCETGGSEPNTHLGTLTPISFVSDLTHSELTEVSVYGEDEEETEVYRYRLQMHVQEPPVGGNVAQYNEWLNTYDGVGKYKVLPCWNGANTVKLMILDSENRKATDELVSQVQEYFDPDSKGMGDGVAPIGAVVTVDTVTEMPVLISCDLVLKDGYTEPTGVKEAVTAYLNSLVLNSTTIEYMPIWAEIYDVESVEKINRLAVYFGDTAMDSSVSPFITSATIADNTIPVLSEESVWGVVK
jgi:uncharacterized phage protein gp47/JayE